MSLQPLIPDATRPDHNDSGSGGVGRVLGCSKNRCSPLSNGKRVRPKPIVWNQQVNPAASTDQAHVLILLPVQFQTCSTSTAQQGCISVKHCRFCGFYQMFGTVKADELNWSRLICWPGAGSGHSGSWVSSMGCRAGCALNCSHGQFKADDAPHCAAEPSLRRQKRRYQFFRPGNSVSFNKRELVLWQ